MRDKIVGGMKLLEAPRRMRALALFDSKMNALNRVVSKGKFDDEGYPVGSADFWRSLYEKFSALSSLFLILGIMSFPLLCLIFYYPMAKYLFFFCMFPLLLCNLYMHRCDKEFVKAEILDTPTYISKWDFMKPLIISFFAGSSAVLYYYIVMFIFLR